MLKSTGSKKTSAIEKAALASASRLVHLVAQIGLLFCPKAGARKSERSSLAPPQINPFLQGQKSASHHKIHKKDVGYDDGTDRTSLNGAFYGIKVALAGLHFVRDVGLFLR